MAIQKIEVERFSLTTSRAFDAVVASLKAGVGNSILPRLRMRPSRMAPLPSWNT